MLDARNCMKFYIGILMLAFSVAAAWYWWPFGHTSSELAEFQRFKQLQQHGLPDFETPSLLTNKAVRLSTLGGEVVIVHFWASWCTPCAKEFPSLLALAQARAPHLQLVAVSLDNKAEEALEFLRYFAPSLMPEAVASAVGLKKGSTKEDPEVSPAAGRRLQNVHIVLDAERQIAQQYALLAVPETYIAQTKGLTMLRKVVGELNWTSAEVLRYFDAL